MTKLECPVEEEIGIALKSERDVQRADSQRDRSLRGRNIQLIESRDLLIVPRIVGMRAFGKNQLAIRIHVCARPGIAEHRIALRHGQFDQQGNRPVVRRKL